MRTGKEEIRQQAASLGIDRVGFVRWQDLETLAPEYDKPSQLSDDLTTLVVLVMRYATGVACASSRSLQQYAAGRTAHHLEEAAARLAYWLEDRDTLASLLSSTVPDLRRQPVGYSCPAGQGSLLLRRAAVQAGLGSLGLNTMLLTPQYGPRVFLAGILTDLDVEPDCAFQEELCPGLEGCGRCAAVCPERAIPLAAACGSSVAEQRGLDVEACARSSQPYGPEKMVNHLRRIFGAASAREAAEVVRENTTLKLWYNLTVLRQAAFTGCIRCELVCPVGEDYPEIEKSRVRRQDLPGGVRRSVNDGFVRIENLTCRES